MRLGKNISETLKRSSKFSYILAKLPIFDHFKILYLVIETCYRLSDTLLIKTKGKLLYDEETEHRSYSLSIKKVDY